MRKLVLFVLAAALISACGRQQIAPSTPVQVTSVSNVPTAEPQAEPTAAPDEPAPAVLVGDAAAGEALFTTFIDGVNFACSTCHNAANIDRLVGPGLLGISETALTRSTGEDAATYIHNAIVNPSAFVVESYPDLLMPQTYGTALTEQQIADLVAYLLSL